MYLFSTQTLMDLICGEPHVMGWAETVVAHGVSISVVSIGRVQAEILATGQGDGRDELDSAFRVVLANAKRTHRIEPFDESTALVWAKLLDRELTYEAGDGTMELDDLSRMVVATAIDRKLILVERPQPYHLLLPDLRVVSPYR